MKIADSELILNTDGSIYHLNLLPEHIADVIIVVGDPDRVSQISKYFDKIEFQIQKREFKTHTGYLGKQKLSVISSGIGTDNIDILMNELDALVNIDLKTKELKTHHKTLKIIRIGTSGSLQKNIACDTLLVSENAIGLDILGQFYEFHQTDLQARITREISNILRLSYTPYMFSTSSDLLNSLAFDFQKGNTLTCPGFYAPQGRELRLKPRIANFTQKLNQFDFNDFKLTNFEMETASYYAFANLLGHEMLSLNAILANRITQEFSKNPSKAVEKLIQTTLERVEKLA